MYDYPEPLEQMCYVSMFLKILEPDRIDDKCDISLIIRLLCN